MARMIRDWTDSQKVHSLSAEAERFFTRLIMKADDFGRYHADLKLLRSYLFPLYGGKIKEEKVSSWLQECVNSDLILCYEVGDKKYLEIKLFDQKLKVRRSRFPPSNEEDRLDLIEGYVYVIGTSFDKPVKIGFSMNPWSRLKEITANHHEPLQILLTFKAEKRLESLIHAAIKSRRVKNEWFSLLPSDIDTLLKYSHKEINQEYLLEILRSNYEDNDEQLRTQKKKKEVEVESESEVETKGPPAKFIKPEVFELEDFFIKSGLDDFTAQAQAKLFINYYESNGWRVGKNQMKSWPAAAAGWKERMKTYTNGNNVIASSTAVSKAGRSEINDRARNSY